MIGLDQSDGLAILRLNRPEKANALTREMLVDLLDAVGKVRSARVMVLTGSGKVFSAGMDLDEASGDLPTAPIWEELSAAIAGFEGLSIAALNGTVAGGALGMVLACDMRVAVPTTQFFYPVMRLGFLPQPSDPERLSALIGPARAKFILMGGQKINARQAFDWGLINRISEEPLTEATALAQDALASDLDHLRAIKLLFR